jgi:hypothetical protein
MKRFNDLCVQGAATMGRDITKGKYTQQWLEEVGCKSDAFGFLLFATTPHPFKAAAETRPFRPSR